MNVGPRLKLRHKGSESDSDSSVTCGGGWTGDDRERDGARRRQNWKRRGLVREYGTFGRGLRVYTWNGGTKTEYLTEMGDGDGPRLMSQGGKAFHESFV